MVRENRQVNHTFSRNEQGLTLVEMMVAMTIGLVLLGGIITVLSSSQSTYRVNEALARMQENARYAFQLLSRDIRMAGYRGCAGDGVAVTNVLEDATGFLWRLDQPLEGFEATDANGWAPALPVGVISSQQGGRDIIVVRGVEGVDTDVLSHSSDSADLSISAGSGLQTGDTVLVSNCQGAAIFQITGISTSGGQYTIEHDGGTGKPNSTTTLGRIFTGGEMARIRTRIYYIRLNPRGIPALYWRRGGNTEELVEAIENLQIQYGEDMNGDRAADIYRTADQVADWDAVVSVRIDLLVQSVEDAIASQPQTYTFNGVSVTPADRRLRQTFSTVIALRNRAS